MATTAFSSKISIDSASGVISISNYDGLDSSTWTNAKIKIKISSVFFGEMTDVHVVTIAFGDSTCQDAFINYGFPNAVPKMELKYSMLVTYFNKAAQADP